MKITMKHVIVYLCIICGMITGKAQILDYNNSIPLDPSHILDEKLTNISFAYSMRILVSDYNGPLIRLRREIDDTEQDFFHGDNDIVDIAAINTWRNDSNVYITRWYDQSGQGRDAIAPIENTTLGVVNQPRFYPASPNPYFQNEGAGGGSRWQRVRGHLVVTEANGTPSTVANVTTGGADGTFIGLIYITQSGRNILGGFGTQCWWASIYGGSFTPGTLVAGTWSPGNRHLRNQWFYHTFTRGSNPAPATDDYARVTLRKTPGRVSFLQAVNNTNYTGNACTSNQAFRIAGREASFVMAGRPRQRYDRQSLARFTEVIMYNTDLTTIESDEIVQNGLTFWGR